MQENTPKTLTFPTQERLQRQKIGGRLFLMLGLLLIGLGFIIGDTFWVFCGAPLTLVGFFVNGYRQVVQIDYLLGKIQAYRGLYFFIRRSDYHVNSFDKIVIRRSAFLSSRFSNLTSKTYEGTLKVKYKVLLAGNSEVEVDFTSEQELAKQWGEQLSEVLNLKIQFEDEKEVQVKTERKMAVMKWASVGILLSALAAMAFVIYQVVTIG